MTSSDTEFFARNPERNYRTRIASPDEASDGAPIGIRQLVLVKRGERPGAYVRRLVHLAETGDLPEEAAKFLFLSPREKTA
jgi:hypothetical protein